jgi:Spy/CpxP family protein refolding chaperone
MNPLTKYGIAAAVTAALAFGQGLGMGPPGGDPPDPQTRIEMRVSFLTSHLSLTDEQKTQATSIFTEAYNASPDERARIQTARQSLADAVKRNDSVAIDQLAGEIGTLSGQLLAVQSKADAAFYAILTPDQQAKYDAMPHFGPGRGFGGPGLGPAGRRQMR